MYRRFADPGARAAGQYAAFGKEIRGLATHLDTLLQAFRRAQQSLTDHGAPPTDRPRWDIASLVDIFGGYEETLEECRRLIESNNRYYDTHSTGVLRNIQFNVMVQPTVERLRARIMLHNSRIQHALKPFEM
jgi:hypothetical protein